MKQGWEIWASSRFLGVCIGYKDQMLLRIQVARLFALFCAVFCPIGLALAQSASPHDLIDGATITVQGTLGIKQQGYKSFLVVKTGEPYIAVFDPTDRRPVREIWIMLAGQNDALRKFAGQAASLSGKVQLEPNSPYYFNGTLIVCDSVQIQSGALLLPITKAQPPVLPAKLEQYHAQVTLSKSGQFSYEGWDVDGHSLGSGKGLLSCSLNGGGDLVNCSCADGFKPDGVGRMENGHFILTEESFWIFAQFEVPESGGIPVKRAVACVREPAH